MEKYEIDFENIDELDIDRLPAGGSGFGCDCAGAMKA